MIECFFDCSSPWTWLGFHNLQPLARELDETVSWRPILVGGIFNTINPSVYASREAPVPAKQAYAKKDLQDWARVSGLTIISPTVFPVNSVKVMRACIFLEPQGLLVPFASAAFKAYWTDNQDISQDGVVAQLCRQVGVDEQAVFAGIAQDAVKQQLRINTEEVMTRGGFGSPTIFVDRTDMYFGNDRLPLVRAAVLRKRAG
jgi:2-hydroxychromene-2-carboxylate isomerase